MTFRQDSPTRFASRLLWCCALVVAGLFGSVDQADAQRTGDPCDSVYIDARGGDDCCFSFFIENNLNSITQVTMTAVGGYEFSDAAGPEGSQVTYQGTRATWSFARGVPARTDDLEACFKPQPNVRTDGTFQVVVNWYAGRTILCSDTLELECKNEEPGCAELIGSEVECLPDGTFGWYFTLKNTSDFWGRNYTIRTNSQNISVEPAGGQANAAVAPGSTFGRSRHIIKGAQPGDVLTFVIEVCGSSTADSRDVRCCTITVRVEMPECEPNEKCIDIGESSIECIDQTASGQNVYQWCFEFRNTGNFPINQIQVGNQTIQTQPVPPGGTGRACVRIVGRPGPTTVGLLVCGVERRVDTIRRGGGIFLDTVFGERECCDMRVELRLPECREEGCFEIVEQEIECDSAGNYIWCFNVRNNASWAMGSLLLVVPPNSATGGNVQIVPNPIRFDRPVPPGGVSQRVCVRIIGARPGVLPVVGFNNASQLGVTCSDSILLRLPECEPHGGDCCDGFNIGLQTVPPVAGSNGFTGLLGLISAGPAPITKASATITYASVNGQPAYGHFVAGTFLNPFGAGTVVPPVLGQELIWQNPAGVNMNNPSFNLNWMRFPPMAPNARTDTLRFCIRWRFTDRECRTCDTLVCYTRVRRRITFGGNTGLTDNKEAVTAGDEGYIGGSLTGENSGRLEILFPELPAAEFGTVTFTGLRLQATGGPTIVGATSQGNTVPLSVEQGLVSGSFSIAAGGDLSIDLNYEGLDDGSRLAHLLILDYESSLEPGVTQQIPLTVTLRRDDLRGGDEIDAVSAVVEGRNVATYALHIRNENKTGEALSGLRLSALGNLEFLAVGPTSGTTEATLRFGVSGEDGHAYVTEASEGAVTLEPGAERKPIYVTVAVQPETTPVVAFATLNEFGETVSEGEIDLTQVSSVGHTGDITRSVATLGNAMPNPTGTEASLGFTLPRSTETSVVLRDARGVEVARLIDGERLDAGAHIVTFSVADLPNGVYFYSLETAEGSETKRIVVRR